LQQRIEHDDLHPAPATGPASPPIPSPPSVQPLLKTAASAEPAWKAQWAQIKERAAAAAVALKAGAGAAAAKISTWRAQSIPVEWNKHVRLAALGVAAVVLGLVLLKVFWPKSRVVPDLRLARLEVHVEPANATFKIFDSTGKDVTRNWQRLPFGEYTIQAARPGFEPREQRYGVNVPFPTPLVLKLTPISQRFELFTTLEALNVTLDGQSTQVADGGQVAVNDLSDGEHKVEIQGRNGIRTDFVFHTTKGGIPEVLSLTASQVRAVAVSSFNGTLRLVKPQTSSDKVSFAIANSAEEEIAPGGSTKEGVGTGNQTLTLVHGPDRVQSPMEMTRGPKVALFLSVNENIGYVVVDLGDQNIRVEVNGKERKARKISGNRLILALEPNKYNVRFSKEGAYYPQEVTLNVEKGKNVPFNTPFTAIPQNGILKVRGGAGTEVKIGDGAWNRVQPDGNLSLPTPLGRQTVQVRKQGFRDWQETREFTGDKEVVLNIGELNLQVVMARVTFVTTPSAATVRLPDGRTATGGSKEFSLRDGKYTYSAEAPGYEEFKGSFEVVNGTERTITVPALTAKTVATLPPPPPVHKPMDGWTDKTIWVQSKDGWWSRKEGSKGVILYSKGVGTFTFTAVCKARLWGCKVPLYVGYANAQNHVEFDVQRDKVVRKIRTNGKTSETSFPLKIKFGETPSFSVTVTAADATVSLLNANNYVKIASLEGSDQDLGKGKFGIDVEQITHFTHQ
jgi:hypothetical protein